MKFFSKATCFTNEECNGSRRLSRCLSAKSSPSKNGPITQKHGTCHFALTLFWEVDQYNYISYVWINYIYINN
jgi:hypothetical protein